MTVDPHTDAATFLLAFLDSLDTDSPSDEEALVDARLSLERLVSRVGTLEAELEVMLGPVDKEWDDSLYTRECRNSHNQECWGHGRALRQRARAVAAERERDEARNLNERIEALLMQDPAPPPDHVFRFFQRLHGVPEVGAPVDPRDEALAAAERRLADTTKALQEMRSIPNEWDLQTNALAKAMWTIAGIALAGVAVVPTTEQPTMKFIGRIPSVPAPEETT